MKYKNTTKGVLKFRAYDKDMLKRVFMLKPSEEVELGKEAHLGGLEMVEEKVSKKKVKEDN